MKNTPSSSSVMKKKPLKWAAQKEHHTSNKNKSGRVSKRTSTNSRHTTSSPVKILTAATTEIMSTIQDVPNPQQKENNKEPISPSSEIERLHSDLEFARDNFATILVHFESLHHAYTRCKPELDESKGATRLGEKEKELLTAYDDLGLQVTHLERKITKLEKRISELKESPEYIKEQNELQKQQQQQQPQSSNISTTTTLSPPLSVCEESDLLFMSSPCTSTDSLASDNYLVSYSRNDYYHYNYTNEWAKKQLGQCQFQVQQVEQQYEPQYQCQQQQIQVPSQIHMMENNQYNFPQHQQYETIYPSSMSMNYFTPPEEQVYYYEKAAAPYDASLSDIYTSYPIYDSY
ncbi:hypothetical protein K501DRAFT_283434 [Backusella circina FSU 941]|nr:hypothetical protein K501DRAFT_283434 [Backusella circina FSU 941]